MNTRSKSRTLLSLTCQVSKIQFLIDNTHINVHTFFFFSHTHTHTHTHTLLFGRTLSTDVLWGSEYKNGYVEWNMQIKILKIQKLINVHFIQIHKFKNRSGGFMKSLLNWGASLYSLGTALLTEIFKINVNMRDSLSFIFITFYAQ
jgi:hypothetical protein